MRVMFLSLVLVAAVRPNHQNLHAKELKSSVKKHHEKASSTGCCSVYDESAGKLTGYCKRGDLEDGCVSFNTETVKHMTVDEEFCEKKGPFNEIPSCWFMQEGCCNATKCLWETSHLRNHVYVLFWMIDISNAILKFCYSPCSGCVSWRWPATWTEHPELPGGKR